MTPIFVGKVDHGKLTLTDRDRFDHYLTGLAGEVQVIVRKPRKDRSDRQNRYFHGVICQMVGDEIGIIPDEAKDLLKMMFLKVEKNGYTTMKQTSKLSTVEMEEFHENCRRWAAETLNINVPTPNEVDYQNL